MATALGPLLLQPPLLRALARLGRDPRARRLHLSAPRNDAVVISGRKLARQIRQEARHEVEQWVAAGNKRPHLSVVLVGENPASHSYVLNKTKAAADVGISSETILRPASVTEEELLDLIVKLNDDTNVDGLLVQLPLPEHIDERKICNAVTPDKDVDGFHVINVGRMCLDQYTMLPATPWGVWEIIKRTGIPTLGKNVVVAGRSKNVGMPIAMLLHTDGRHERPGGDATVTISHRYTPKEQLKQHTILADIVVAAAGKAGRNRLGSKLQVLRRNGGGVLLRLGVTLVLYVRRAVGKFSGDEALPDPSLPEPLGHAFPQPPSVCKKELQFRGPLLLSPVTQLLQLA
ncbi:bifunctional methylenetetrahydrofolate dehydrogenase/cyclohydrolase, mitochondrial isoform X1 [Alligator sinensis]|uniref:methenyltetrahydrofolate cyclohydrolase n=1 Tax=Alligator sinensis TaxID=38654 RepID=A0A3Q0HAG5_ALLSI|nr:bifunctional methylenetetrahydrofolate dehydrogenase/cyclohydrolase, mitochondrial isoform X1 [Alligator sinensis]